MIHFIFAGNYSQSRNWYLDNMRELEGEGFFKYDSVPFTYVNSFSLVDKFHNFIYHEVGNYETSSSWQRLTDIFGKEYKLKEVNLLLMLKDILGYEPILNEEELKSLLTDEGIL